MGIQKKRGPGLVGEVEDPASRGASVTRLRPIVERLPPLRQQHSEVSGHSVRIARRMVRERLRRARFFKSDLFADPAWDMMLDIFIAEAEGRETPVMNLCLSSQVPETTTLRWVKTLEQAGIFVRQKDEHDQRRVLVRLSPPAALALASYLEDQD